MRKKMIARYISEVESFNRIVRRNIDSEVAKSQYMLCQGMRYMLEEIGIEVIIDMHSANEEVFKMTINGVTYEQNIFSHLFNER